MLSYMSCLYILEIKFLIGCIFYKYLILYYGLSFYGFLCHAKAFNLVPLCFYYFRRWIKKELAAIYVKDCSACVFL